MSERIINRKLSIYEKAGARKPCENKKQQKEIKRQRKIQTEPGENIRRL